MRVAKTIVILGGGTAGWMCAAALSPLIATGLLRVVLVESDDIGTVGVGEATLPHIKAFNDSLGIDESEFMRRTKATFKLGIEFRGWGQQGNSYIHPFGAFGEDWAGIGFHHHWLRARTAGAEVAPLEAYSLAIAACRAGRFAFPASDATSLRGRYGYAYHFDAGLYAGFMRELAERRGVLRREGKVTEVQQSETGDVTALTLASGETVTGDLFVDCSGFAGLLIDKALNVGWEDWTPWLPCDRAWAIPSLRSEAAQARADGRGAQSRLPDDTSSGGLTPYTRSTACEAGWQWRIPLQHRTGNGYVFSSAHTSEDDARDSLLANLDAPPLADPKLLKFRAGRRHQSWSRNVVAVGLASGFLEPLESTSIYLIQVAAQRLVSLLSAAPCDPRLAAEFNRAIDTEYERVRDFLILHYHANSRDEPLWRDARHMAIPDSLAARIAIFRRRGHIDHYRDGLFSPPSWLAVFNGQDLPAEGHDPLAGALPLDALADRLSGLKARIDSEVAAMPSHAEALKDLLGVHAGEPA